MARRTENLLFPAPPQGVVKRQEVKTILVRNGVVIEERYERVFFDEDLIEYNDAKTTTPLHQHSDKS